MRTESAHRRNLDGGVRRRRKQALGVDELAGTQEVANRHAKRSERLARDILARQLEVQRKSVRPRGHSPRVTLAKIQIRAALQPLPDGRRRRGGRADSEQRSLKVSSYVREDQGCGPRTIMSVRAAWERRGTWHDPHHRLTSE